MGFPYTANVPCVGRSGSLVLAWKKEIDLAVVSTSNRGIYVTTKDIIHSKTCHISFIYEEPNSALRQAFYETNACYHLYQNFCNVFDLHDPGFYGLRFTWSNMQHGPDLILERLDMCLVNPYAELLCPKFYVNNLPRDSSDHFPMHIGFNFEVNFMPKPFHFMAMCMEDPTCRDVIANAWSVNVIGSHAYKLKAKLLNTKKGLKGWNKISFGNIQTNIKTTREELADHQTFSPSDSSSTSRLRSRLEYLYNLEELYWKDKSREICLLERDRNSPYFHRVTLFRRKRNAISWIKNSLGTVLTDRNNIRTSFVDYFRNMYSSQPQ
ncbi:uncharacterized protein LOC113312235 [Papaver somniferum]|uniref:uncharacterized protein LOC113312235 n=1 Tax=Papaver somniferum TaxID=3469 RepID=UPI000E7000A7|nr:uncharacterized protein LOC113312235 [Papaver somniferum]